MAAPTFVTGTLVESLTSTDGTSHTINRPSGVAGNLTIVIIGFDGGSTVVFTDTPGFTEFMRRDNGTTHGVIDFYHVDTGAEGSTVTFTTDDAEKLAAIAFHASGAADPASVAIQVQTTTGASSTTKDCPSLTLAESRDY